MAFAWRLNKPRTSTTPNSLELLYQVMKDNISVQVQEINSLDSKANNVQVATTTLLGAALGFLAILKSGTSSTTGGLTTGLTLQLIALGILVLVYLPAIFYASRGYSVRNFQRAFLPATISPPIEDVHVSQANETIAVNTINEIMKGAYGKPEEESMAAMTNEMVKDYLINRDIIEKKVRDIRRAGYFLLTETIVFMIVLVLSALTALKITP